MSKREEISSSYNALIKLHPTPPPFSDATLNMLRYIASPDELLAFLSTVRAMRAGYSIGSWESELVIDIITRLAAKSGEVAKLNNS